MRTKKDLALDAVLLLHMLDCAKPMDGKTKLQKIPFFVELQLKRAGLRGPHFRFFRWNFGPFSSEVCETFGKLVKRGFLTKNTGALTERGRFLVELAIPALAEIEGNAPIFRVMDAALRTYGSKPGRELKKMAYEAMIACEGRPARSVKNTPFGTDLIEPDAGGMEFPEDLEALVREELNLTDKQLEEARQRFPETERDLAARLEALMSGAQPSE